MIPYIIAAIISLASCVITALFFISDKWAKQWEEQEEMTTKHGGYDDETN